MNWGVGDRGDRSKAQQWAELSGGGSSRDPGQAYARRVEPY